MITFSDLPQVTPYQLFHDSYLKASAAEQPHVHAAAISSYDPARQLVDSRYVNIKYIEGQDWLFFTNYNSPKAAAFSQHDQICALFFWPRTYTQIRIHANITKVSPERSDMHFHGRSDPKNALAIASAQSQSIDSIQTVIANFDRVLKNADLRKRPEYWGGYVFRPFYFEFWKGSEYRLNHRRAFKCNGNEWDETVLEP